MQLVEYNAPKRAKHVGCVGACEKQRELLRRCEEDVGGIPALALALGCGRIAGARFEPDIQTHLAHRTLQVARNVDRKRLQRRYVQSVQTLRARQRTSGRPQVTQPYIAPAQLNERRQKPRKGLAAAGRRDQQRGPPCPRLRQQVELMRTRLPAPACEPAREHVRQRGILEKVTGGFHSQCVATTIRPGTALPFSVRVEAQSRLTVFSAAAASAARTCASP